MLAIKGHSEIWNSWHVGETMHVPVVTFQADGHELEALLDAIEKAGIKVVYPSEIRVPVL